MRRTLLSVISLILVCLVVLTSCYNDLDSQSKETDSTVKHTETEEKNSVYDELTDIFDGIESDSDEDEALDTDINTNVDTNVDTDADTDINTNVSGGDETQTDTEKDNGEETQPEEGGSGSGDENENGGQSGSGSGNENENSGQTGSGSGNENENGGQSGSGSGNENENSGQTGSGSGNENENGGNNSGNTEQGGTNEGTDSGSNVQPDPIPDTMPASKNYQGTMYYTTTNGDSKSCNIDFVVDYRALIDGNNNVYSKNLSKLSILFASDIYDDLYVKLTSGATGGNDTVTTFGTLLGLENVKNYNITGSSYDVDKDDVTQFVVGHKNVVYNGVVREIIIVSVRGTNATNEEWSSNFDVGADTSEYYGIMGESHPHWKDKNNHKGFDVATNRVYDRLIEYINDYVDSGAQKSILITGHSRGAAIANILSKMFSDKSDYRTYGYTFAAPNTTTASSASNYKNIFNVVNTDDIITYLPLAEWGFTKYGVTKTISVAESYESALPYTLTATKNSFEWFLDEFDYNPDSGTQDTLATFTKLATCREELYLLDTAEDGTVEIGNYSTSADAEAKRSDWETALKNEKLFKFCKMTIYSKTTTGIFGGTKYYLTITYTPAYFMQLLSDVTTGDCDMLERVPKLKGKYMDAAKAFALSSGKLFVGGMEHPHMQPTYYLIARNDFLTLDELNK